MARIARFEDLIAWQKGMDLAEGVHRATRSFASEDLQGAYRSHVAIARGLKHAEVRTQLELCRRLALIEQQLLQKLIALAEEVGRILSGLWRSLWVGAVCYSLTLIVFLIGLPWTIVHTLMP